VVCLRFMQEKSIKKCSVYCVHVSFVHGGPLFSVNVPHIEMLSIVDVNSVHLLSRWNGFAHGVLENASLLDNPLITWNSHLAGEVKPSALPVIVQHILRHNIINNPLLREYQSVLEFPHPKYAVPVLGCAAIRHIIADNIAKAPIDIAAMDENYVSSLLATSEFAHHTFDSNSCQPATNLFDVGCVTLRKTGVQKRLLLHADGLPALDQDNCNLSIETALFPFLFPFGRGAYVGRSGVSFTEYLRMQMMAMFSPFTLFTLYLLLMYQARKDFVLITGSRDVAYESAMKRYRKKFPGYTDDQVFSHVLKHNVPRTLPGSPSWHRRNLKGLLCMVDYWGLPQLFLTLTADEMSKTKWPEIAHLNEFLQSTYNSKFDWKSAPGECCHIFHDRFQKFLRRYILPKEGGILGRVLHWVVRYEVQSRGSLHVYILLWVHSEDIDRVTNEIRASIPGSLDEKGEKVIPPKDPAGNLLYKYVVGKQLHECSEAKGCTKDGKPCSRGFPYKPHFGCSELDPTISRWRYFRPGYLHSNVVPYHPVVLLL
jgi:hypothetical protein